MSAEIELPILIPPEDHDAGYTNLPVKLRSGRETTLRLNAPPARVAARVQVRMLRGEDFDLNEELLRICNADADLVDKLDVDEISKVYLACQQLAWGIETQKKIIAEGMRLAAAATPPPSTPSPSSDSKPSASSADGAASSSGAGPG